MLADVRARVAAAVAAREDNVPAQAQAAPRHHGSEVRGSQRSSTGPLQYLH